MSAKPPPASDVHWFNARGTRFFVSEITLSLLGGDCGLTVLTRAAEALPAATDGGSPPAILLDEDYAYVRTVINCASCGIAIVDPGVNIKGVFALARKWQCKHVTWMLDMSLI